MTEALTHAPPQDEAHEVPDVVTPDAATPDVTQHDAVTPDVTQPQVVEPAAGIVAPSARPGPATTGSAGPTAAKPAPVPVPIPPRAATTAVPAAREAAPAPGPSPEATELLRAAVTFGRVDADGTVSVLTGDGDRPVGQFPDTAPNEALVYYVRKFEELVGQVDLFAQRVRAGSLNPKDARGGLTKLQEAVALPAAVGDVDGLQRWVAALAADVDRRSKEAEARRNAAKAKAAKAREALVVEAEAIAATPAGQVHFKTAMDRLREIVEEWKAQQKSGPRLDRSVEDPLWQRLSAARSVVDRGRRQHMSTVQEQRETVRRAKETIITEAEGLAGSTDWRATAEAFRGLMDRWKSAGRLSKSEDDELWARFRGAQDRFHDARTATFAQQDEEYRGNLAVKEKLLVEAEALLPVTDLPAAKRALRDLQDRWDAAGRVPRADMDRIERRMSAVADTIREADQSRWTKTNPEALARARNVVDQLESGIASLRRDVEKAEAASDTRGAERARAALQARQAWLDQARTALRDLGG